MERFWEKVDVRENDECWEWQAATRNGYGAIKINGSVVDAHRVAYKLSEEDEIPDGMFICHHCDNRVCVNPDHLFLGTRSDNMKDAYDKGRLDDVLRKAREKAIGKSLKGGEHGNASLSESEVVQIIKLLEETDLTHGEISNRFNICREEVTRINTGERWGHLKQES